MEATGVKDKRCADALSCFADVSDVHLLLPVLLRLLLAPLPTPPLPRNSQTALIFVYMAIFGIAVAFSSGLDFFKTWVAHASLHSRRRI